MATPFQWPSHGNFPNVRGWVNQCNGVVLWHVTPVFQALGLSSKKTGVWNQKPVVPNLFNFSRMNVLKFELSFSFSRILCPFEEIYQPHFQNAEVHQRQPLASFSPAASAINLCSLTNKSASTSTNNISLSKEMSSWHPLAKVQSADRNKKELCDTTLISKEDMDNYLEGCTVSSTSMLAAQMLAWCVGHRRDHNSSMMKLS